MIKIEERPDKHEIILHLNFKVVSYFDKVQLYRIFKTEGKYSLLRRIEKVISAHIENVIEQEVHDSEVEIIFSLEGD